MTQVLGTILLCVVAFVCILFMFWIQWYMDEERRYKDAMTYIDTGLTVDDLNTNKEEEENE